MEMKWLVITTGLIGLLMVPLLSVGQAAPVGDGRLPGVTDAMLKADFWAVKLPAARQLILDPAGIAAFNRAIYAALPQVVVDLDAFPDTVERARLRQWLSIDRMPRGQERYSDGKLLGGSFYDRLEQNLNLPAIRETNPVVWGFTVRRSDLRTFPTDEAASEDDESDDFDLFQETAVNIAEPLAVLHRSADGQWLYVQLVNYRGWLKAADVALAQSRQEWQLCRAKAFVVITGSKVAPRDAVMGKPMADWRAGMGAKLPFVGMEKDGYQVEIPRRGDHGAVVWQKAWIHGKADVSVGYLPYTRTNILRQAFKMLGEHYGWGGLDEGRDCSSFIMDIYNVFGILAPRNADQQEAVPGRRIQLRGIVDTATRYALLDRADPGATLHMRNHVMMYLGTHDGKHYAIHSLGSYGDAAHPRADGSLPRIGVMQIVVGDLDLPLRSGRRFIDVLTSANVWQPQ
jgi:hypothetical protein